MPKRIRTEELDPSKLQGEPRERLLDELYQVQNTVFEGVDKKSFVKYVIDSPAQKNWLYLFKKEGKIIGYLALHQYEKTLEGKAVTIFRAESGVLREGRGQVPIQSILLRRLLLYSLFHPQKTIYYLGSLVHPSSYHGFARYISEIWPTYKRPTPPEIHGFLCRLGDEFGLQTVDPKNLLLRNVGWTTRDSEEEKRYWQTCEKPTARFFVETNPGYSQGHGLLTLIPISAGVALRSAFNYFGGLFKRLRDRVQATTQAFPLFAPRLATNDLLLLGRVPILRSLRLDTLLRLLELAKIVLYTPGRFVFRQGESSESMFFLMSGAAYVLLDAQGKEIILDELTQGDLFGEMGFLFNSPRTASIRVAATAKVLKITKENLKEIASNEPEIERLLWETIDHRRFDTYLRSTPRFASMSSEARKEWFQGSRIEILDAGEESTLAPETSVFLVIGQVEVKQQTSWLTNQAPSLIEAKGHLALRAVERTRLLLLPPGKKDSD